MGKPFLSDVSPAICALRDSIPVFYQLHFLTTLFNASAAGICYPAGMRRMGNTTGMHGQWLPLLSVSKITWMGTG
jgi:hypothetical protein